MNNSYSHRKSEIQANISNTNKKKEKELENKVKDLEHIIADQKKQLSRYQELNKQLLEKVKENE